MTQFGRSRTRTYTAQHFWVQIDQIEVAGFQSCSSIVMETEILEYAEGGRNTGVHQLPGRVRYRPITLQRGIDETNALFDWYQETLHGRGFRRNISIILYDEQRNPVRRWELLGAYPIRWEGANLHAASDSVAIESVELAFEAIREQR